MIWRILLAGLVSSLALAAIHLGLRYWIRGEWMHVVWRYVIGVVAMFVPLTVLWWGLPEVVLSLWVMAGMTGLTVGGLYAAGDWWETYHQAREKGEQVRYLEGQWPE